MPNGLISSLSNWGVPSQVLITLGFYLVAGLTCLFAFLVVTSRNIFHSAMYLAVTLLGVSAVYLFLDAEFLAVIQIIIYVGAVVTLFAFAIMLTSRISDKAIRQVNRQVAASCLLVAALFFVVIHLIAQSPWQASVATEQHALGIEDLGKSLMTNYILPFEVVSLLLLAALVGALVIGKGKKP